MFPSKASFIITDKGDQAVYGLPQLSSKTKMPIGKPAMLDHLELLVVVQT